MTDFSHLPLLIEPDDLAPHLEDRHLILVDLSSHEHYVQGHIPGALYVDFKRTQLGQPPAPGLLPARASLETLFSELGHHPDATYVVYDDEGGGWAGRFIWLLDVIGHHRYHYLNGGRQGWLAAGLPVNQDSEHAQPSHVSLSIDSRPTATHEYIRERLGADDLVVWDARSAPEYRGEKVLAARGGHIPGAINFEWTDGMDKDNALRIRRDIASVLAGLGITPDKEIITHCQTHHRSGYTYLLAKVLGYPRVKGYAGSWSEWGNLPDTPIEV